MRDRIIQAVCVLVAAIGIATGGARVDAKAAGNGFAQLLQELGTQGGKSGGIAGAQGFALGETTDRLQWSLRSEGEALA